MVEQSRQESLRNFLEACTSPRLLSKAPIAIVVFLTTLVHLATSVDLGFRDLHIRTPISIISTLPLFLSIWAAQKLSQKSYIRRFTLIPISYLVGGGLRGAFLEYLLQQTGVLQGEFTSYRILAGITIVSTTCLLVSFTWTKSEEARLKVSELQQETSQLATALEELRKKKESDDPKALNEIHERISRELLRVIHIGSTEIQGSLELLVKDVIKPLSQDFAKEIERWEPPETRELQVTFRRFWSSLDPLQHLRTPVVGIIALAFSTIASLFALFEFRDAVEVILGVSITLLITTKIVFRLVSPMIHKVAAPLRDLLVTLTFVVVAIPAIWAERIALSNTDNPDIYAAATLIITPVFAWMIVLGSASFRLTTDTAEKLIVIRDDLIWVIARVNLLNWYRKGVISRLLHGPVQNSIQVALLRLQSADEKEVLDIVNEVLVRIDKSLQDILNPDVSGPIELQTLESLKNDWSGIAEIEFRMTDSFRIASAEDLAAASIVTDLVHEICSNAIRHGRAKDIAILADKERGSLRLTIEDDGNPISRLSGSFGLGIQFLDACTLDWNRKVVAGKNRLEFRVPTTYLFQLQDK